MSIKQLITSKSVVLTCLGLLVPIGIGLIYYESHAEGGLALKLLLPAIYVVIVSLLVRTGVVPIPDGAQRGILSGHIRVSDLLKTAVCFFASLLWAIIGVRLFSDTPAGNAGLMIPSLLLLIASGFFFVRSVSRRSRQ